MSNNKTMNQAKAQRNAEFYTQLDDIEEELKHYRKHFKDKVVFCNCDDPYESNFFKYFVLHFNQLHLKKLICTCYSGSPVMGDQISLFDVNKGDEKTPYKAEVTKVYDITGDGAISMDDIKELFLQGENKLDKLEGNGDFRSDECIEILKEADIVVTNPPFGLFREYIAQLIKYQKHFIVWGDMNALTFKDFFPYIRDNKIWTGYIVNKTHIFRIPLSYKKWDEKVTKKINDGNHYCKVPAITVYTNLDIKKRHEEMILFREYDPETYPKFINYDAINVKTVVDIPCDYDGEMGVPISFINSYNPDQFELIGTSLELATPIKTIAPKGTYMQGGNRFYSQNLTEKDITRGYKYHREYDRLVIKNKNPKR